MGRLESDGRFDCEAEGDMGGDVAELDPELAGTRWVAE